MANQVKLINTKAEFDEALASKDVVLVDFFADWCGPCRIIAPKIQNMAEEFPAVGFFKVNVDEAEEELTANYEVQALPTFMIFSKGQKVETVVGASEAKVKEALVKHC